MSVSMLALALAGQAAAAAPPAAAPKGAQAATAPKGAQARFDAASTAAGDGRCAEAVQGFATLAGARNPLLVATIDVRNGRCLVELGRVDEGKAAIARGLPVLAAKGEAFAGDVYDAHLALGRAAQRGFDYDTAAREYRSAVDLVTGGARVPGLLRLAQVTMFDHDGRALAAAEEARTLALAEPDMGKKDLAAVQTVHARVLLNEGRAKEAYAELKDSLAKQGGLTSRVGASDITTRSDLAIAALKNGDRDNARLYLAYTGAGRMRDTPFSSAAAMAPPTCGEGGLLPEDEAIVEFSLERDGHVAGVAPVYTSGGRAKALAFARAVTDWSWRAEDAAKVPALFRATTRVELRCVKADGAPGLTRPLADAFDAWLATQGAGTPAWDGRPAALALPMQRAALAAATATRDAAAQVQAALALADNPVLDDKEKPALHATARAAAASLSPPVPVRTFVAIAAPETPGENDDAWRARLRTLLAQPDVARDPLSAATLRLLIARPAYRKGPPADAGALLAAVSGDAALPARHPLKIAALLAEANVLAAKGDVAGARAVFDRTGLTAEQCATIGVQPAVQRMGAGANDFPMEAQRLGFEGWVRTAFDIAADGRTVAPRAVIAYPPFIFDEAANGIIRDARFSSTFRPEGALACSGQQQSVRFLLPGG
jgi:hypothetical protein